jgi:hypothetical protein
MNTATATLNNLPNNLAALRTGTAEDGRATFRLGADAATSLRDLNSRAPHGWSFRLAANGVDAVLTCDNIR